MNPANGLVADTSREGSPCSIGVVGFALSVYPVAVERGWMSRADAVARTVAALRFFRDSDQSGGFPWRDGRGHGVACSMPALTSATPRRRIVDAERL